MINFFTDTRFPVVILDVFAKHEKANYTQAELAEVREIAKRLTGSYTPGA